MHYTIKPTNFLSTSPAATLYKRTSPEDVPSAIESLAFELDDCLEVFDFFLL